MEPTPTPGTAALKVGDTLGNGVFEFAPILSGLMGLDYHASSIGIDFGVVAPGVKRIELVPDKDYTTHRINEDTIALYVSNDNINYTLVPKANWEYQKDDQGIITLTLKERLATRYLKLHVKYDERGWDFKPVNKATFLNEIAKMLRVYQEADSRTEEYQYDMAGNRKLLRVTIARTLDYHSQYYTNTDRLKTDGKYAFVYDEAGNMVKKGNTFTISGDTVTFTDTSGEGVEYWEYRYDLLNRLVEVIKNGSKVAEYEYDPEGFRVVAKKYLNDTTLKEKRHYIFQGTEPLFEKNITTGKMKSFVYALGKHLARVDGAIGDPDAKKYWYVTDNLGSVRAVTDKDGKKVWSADYLAFGTQFGKDGNPDFEELHSFTGKELDPDTGLYYYCARWYDAELGRFISEDPAGDPNNPNLYVYGRNNPLRFIDPTGLYGYDPSTGTISHADGTITDTSGNVISAPDDGSNAGYYYGGVGSIGGGPGREGKETSRTGNVETTWDKDGKKVSETIFDEDGNLKGTKYYSPDGKPQLGYSYNEDGTVGSITGYNADGSSLTITFGKNGNITSKVYKASKEYKGNYRYMSCLEDANPIAAAISAALALLNLAGKVEANVIVDVTVTVTTDNQVTVAVSVRSSLTDPRSGNLEADGDAVLNTIVSVSINNYTGKGLINQMKNSKSIAQGGQAFSTDSSLPGSNSIDSQQFGISAQLPSMYSTSFEVSVTSKSYSMADTSEPGVVSGGWSGGVNITIQGTTF